MELVQLSVKALSFFIVILGVAGQSFYENAVEDSNRPDPGVLALPDGSGYVMVSTSNYGENGEDPAFPMMFSTDLVNWEERGYVFPAGLWPVWALMDMWAPEIHWVGDNFHVYFSARKIADLRLAIGVARSVNSSNPFGPYEDLGTPLIEDDKGAIDIHYFRDPVSMIPYLVWKTDDNALGQPSSIYMRQVEEDGITFVTGSQTFTLMTATEDSDANVVEGPWIFFRDPFYYLIFSGNGYANVEYHATVSRSSSPTGPYERYTGEYFLHTDKDRFDVGENCTFVGPGHGSAVYVAGSDTWWYVYHSWKYDLVNVNPPGRVLLLDKIQWLSDDWPLIGVPSDYPVEAPH